MCARVWVTCACVWMGSNRGDSPAAPPGPATRDPPRQREENRTSLARGRTAELRDQQRRRRVHLKIRISATFDFPIGSARPGLP